MLDEPLPDAVAEANDPASADRRYSEAVAILRERTRDTTRFRLVFAENMEYGFRRNSLGLRSLALSIAALTVVFSIALLVGGGGHQAERWARWGLAAAISGAALFYWWRLVTREWVRAAAELYADRLLDAIETVRADTQND